MDYIKTTLAGAGGVVACLAGCACAIAPIVLIVYEGIYAFNNPDKEAWLGILPDGQNQLFADQEAGNLEKATGLVDIHARFITWFLWGFITALMPIALVLLFLAATVINPNLGTCVSAMNACAFGCSSLAWWITGIVWRFRSDGAFASGDIVPKGKTLEEWTDIVSDGDSLYQYKSGNFMAIYYFICFGLVATSCGCTIIGAIYHCVAGGK